MSNQVYWQQRLLDDIYKSNSKALEKKIISLYKQALNHIDSDLRNLWLRMLEDGEISASTLYKNNRYRALQETIHNELHKLGVKQNDLMQLSLLDGYKQAFTGTAKGLGIKSGWDIFNQNIAKSIVEGNFKGATYSDRIWSNMDALKQQIEKSVVDTCINGQDVRKASRLIRDRMDVSYSDASRLVRTETMRTLNSAQKQSYTENGYSKGYYLVGKDDRTCDYCEQRAMETRLNPEPLDYMDEVHHPNCRCTIIPIIE